MDTKEFNTALIERLSSGKSIKSVLKRVGYEQLLALQETLNQEVARKKELFEASEREKHEKAEKVEKAKELLSQLGLSIQDINLHK